MGTSRKRGAAPSVSLAVQAWHIKHRFPNFTYRWKWGEGQWQGTLQPREVSPVYRVQIRYRPRGVPRVSVVSPQLSPKAQHLYQGGFLCLYWSEEWAWHEEALIAETIIPWAALWLLNYELLLDAGEWLGPSSHQQSPKWGKE
jgi:hypothetical protein